MTICERLTSSHVGSKSKTSNTEKNKKKKQMKISDLWKHIVCLFVCFWWILLTIYKKPTKIKKKNHNNNNFILSLSIGVNSRVGKQARPFFCFLFLLLLIYKHQSMACQNPLPSSSSSFGEGFFLFIFNDKIFYFSRCLIQTFIDINILYVYKYLHSKT